MNTVTEQQIPYSHELDWPEGMRPFETVDFEIQKNPFPQYAWMRKHAPVLRTYTEARDVWFISRYEDVRTALRTPKVFSSAVVTPQPLVFLTLFDPPEQSRLRQIVAKPFSPKGIEVLEEQIREYAETYLDELIADGGGDVVDRFAIRLTMATISTHLGLPPEDFHKMKDWSDYVSSYFGRLARQAPGLEGDEEGANEFFAYLLDHVKKIDRDSDTVGATVARLLDEGKLTDREAMHFCAFLFTAGHETTTILLANSFLELEKDPALKERIANNPEDAAKIVEEMARYKGTVQRLSRKTTQDVEVNGVTIPAGQIVVLLPGSANRDETQFENPDVFDIDRNTDGHLGFGHGIHACLGQHLARLEGGIGVQLMAKKLDKIRLDPEHPVEYVVGGNLANTGPSVLPATFEAAAAAGCPFHKG